jgi:hypothetical protein
LLCRREFGCLREPLGSGGLGGLVGGVLHGRIVRFQGLTGRANLRESLGVLGVRAAA